MFQKVIRNVNVPRRSFRIVCSAWIRKVCNEGRRHNLNNLTEIMDNQNDQDVLALLKNKGFSDEDQQFWLPRVLLAPKETQWYIIEFLTTVSGGAEWLRLIQEKKEQALFTGDRGLWEQVLNDEVAVLPS